MIIIQSVEITNFRSIVKIDGGLHANHLNIIVGKNDIGKSNFLKALNLFFNGETEIGNQFRFKDDFSKYAVTPKKKAEEVVIKITFNSSDRYKNSENIVWCKIWRKEGLYEDKLLTVSGKAIDARSGSTQWVKKIKYKYVPAVRGNEYFNHLMGELHDALSEINPTSFNRASNEFIDGLKSQVEELVNDISSRLGYNSQIGMPSDFKSLFATLDFGLNKNGTIVSLNKRGDGIKAQHIPVILRFIANHYKSVSGRGVITPDTIWGFEEPENNMEMGNAFKLSKIFLSYSEDLQIFINTHSPAFYSLTKDNTTNSTLYLAKMNKVGDKNDTKIIKVSVENIELVDEEMGILPIVSDYLQKEVQKRQEIDKKLKELEEEITKFNLPIVITEGKTDVSILNCAWKVLYGTELKPFEIIAADNRTDGNGGNGGYTALNRLIESVRHDSPIHIALYDRDKGGFSEGFKKLSKNFSDEMYNNNEVKVHQNKKAFATPLPVVPELKKFADAENLCIEFYFDEKDFTKTHYNKGLVFDKGKIITKNSRGITLSTEDNNAIEEYSIKEGKLGFAESVVPTFDSNSFRHFKTIFELLKNIIDANA